VLATGSLKHLPRDDKAELLRTLTRELSRVGVISARPRLILGARVPIAKVVHARTGVKCDLSVGGWDSSWKSAAVGEAVGSARDASSSSSPSTFSFSPSLPPPPPPHTLQQQTDAAALARLAKAWARTAGLGDAASAGLNSFSITLLSLFHLQMTKSRKGRRGSTIKPLFELMGLQRAEGELAGEEEMEEEEEEEMEEEDEDMKKKMEEKRGKSRCYHRVVHHLQAPLEQRRPLAGGVLQAHAGRALEELRRNAAAAEGEAAAATAAAPSSPPLPSSSSSTSAPAPAPSSSTSSSSSSIFGFLFPSRVPSSPPAASAPAAGAGAEPQQQQQLDDDDDDLVGLLAGFLSGLSWAMERWRSSPRARARVRASVWHGEFAPGAWGKAYAAGIEGAESFEGEFLSFFFFFKKRNSLFSLFLSRSLPKKQQTRSTSPKTAPGRSAAGRGTASSKWPGPARRRCSRASRRRRPEEGSRGTKQQRRAKGPPTPGASSRSCLVSGRSMW